MTGEPDVGAEELPASLEKPGHGAAMTWSDGALYVLAGENRTAFYSYAPATDVWTARADVPVNSDERGPRAGAGMVAVNGLVYLLKGNSTRDLLVYDPTQDVWSAAPSVPAGVKGTSVRTGGALATDGSRLYVVKGSGREFYTLHLASGTWQQLADLPVKARVGTVLTCVEGVVYAVFGGTWLSYRYDRDLDSWVRLEDVPFGADGRKVAVGAAAAGAGDCFLFEKGRKTSELWFYVPGEPVFGSEPGRANPMTAGGLTVNAQWRPVNPAGTRLAVPVRSPSRIRLYNAGGALVRAVDAGTPVELDLQGIGHGVYLLKITDNSGTLTRSVVVGN